jgi:CMP-N,N'-diacetyllegionaminic acid synthase
MIRNKTVLAIIPARGGSKGLSGKNIKPVGGKPLIAWTIEAALASKFIDRVVLSSDDEDIINTAKHYGCEVPFVRPAELAQDDSPAIDTVLHALDHLPHYDITVLLQPTCPLRSSNDIDTALTTMLSNNAKSCVSVTIPNKSPYWMYVVNGYQRLKPLLDKEFTAKQRQDLPDVYILNGAIYTIYTDILFNTRNFVPDGTVPFIMPKERSVDVDYQMDLDFVEFLLHKYPQ